MASGVKLVFFAFILAVVIGLLVQLPQVDIDKDAVISSSAWYWVRAALYFIPIHTAINIGTIIIGLGIWSLITSVGKSFWDLLPFK